MWGEVRSAVPGAGELAVTSTTRDKLSPRQPLCLSWAHGVGILSPLHIRSSAVSPVKPSEATSAPWAGVCVVLSPRLQSCGLEWGKFPAGSKKSQRAACTISAVPGAVAPPSQIKQRAVELCWLPGSALQRLESSAQGHLSLAPWQKAAPPAPGLRLVPAVSEPCV